MFRRVTSVCGRDARWVTSSPGLVLRMDMGRRMVSSTTTSSIPPPSSPFSRLLVRCSPHRRVATALAISYACRGTCTFAATGAQLVPAPSCDPAAPPAATSASSGPYTPAYSEVSGATTLTSPPPLPEREGQGERASSSASPSTEGSQGKKIPVLDQLIGYYVNIQSRKMYYKDFLRMEHQAVRWAFADIRKNSEALAHGLLQTGVRPGDRILAVQPSNCETLVMQLACAKVGALLCVVPHQTISADKLRYYLNAFQPVHLIAREWINVPEKNPTRPGGAEEIERNMHFWDTLYHVLPELGLSYPGQKFQWVHSQEFFFLKKVILTDHNMNLLGATPMRKLLVWGPFSYYEQRLRRLSALLHPDDPVLALEDPYPALEDKIHITYSHRQCVNAGFLLGQLLGWKAETRFGVLPNHHVDPIGSILAPFAALTSGAVLVHLHGDLFTVDHAVNVMEKLCVEEVSTILGTSNDFDILLRQSENFDEDQFEHLRSLVLFENLAARLPDGSEAPDQGSSLTDEYLQKLHKAFHLSEDADVFVFSGTMESCFMMCWRSLKKGFLGLVPHVEAKAVGDRGAGEAKILAEGTRGQLRLKGPHISGGYYNNAGLLTELVDEMGFTSTSRDVIIEAKGKHISILPTQVY